MSENPEPTPKAAMPGPDADAPTRPAKVWAIVGIVCGVAVAAAVLNQADVFGPEANAESSAQRRPTAVRIASAATTDLTLRVEYPGELDAEVAELSAQVTGRILDVKVDIGDRVAKGDELVRIDVAPAEREVGQARAEVRSAEASRRRAAAELKAAKAELERGKALRKEQLISVQALEALEAKVDVLEAQVDAADAQHLQSKARVGTLSEAIRDARLRAPFDGAVSERYLDVGALVQPSRTIVRLVKAGPLRVRFRVPERDLGRVKAGLPFELTTQATGAEKFRGTVARMSAEVSRTDRTAAVEGVLNASAETLRPGMYAVVHLTLGTLKGATVVPSAAIVERRERGQPETGVFVVEEDRARWKRVAVEAASDGRTAVEGVASGARVITLGHENLKEGAPVNVAEVVKL